MGACASPCKHMHGVPEAYEKASAPKFLRALA